MPYEKSDAKLSQLIDTITAQAQEIRDGLQAAGFEENEIHQEIHAQRDAAWEVVLDEIKQHDAAERALETQREVLAREVGERPGKDATKFNFTDALNVVAGLYFLVLLIWGTIRLLSDWRHALGSFATLAYTVGPLVLLGIACGFLNARRERNQAARFKDRTDAWLKQRDEASALHGITSLELSLKSYSQDIDKLLHERLRQMMTAAINRRLKPSYAPVFEIKKPRGFGEIFDKRFAIQTPARRRLQFLLKSMPGGSIGIAGSRGAGKTTLLKLFCGPKRVIEELKGKPVLGALVSAPVAYQAREFILYLFSAVCQNVIEMEGGKYTFTGKLEDAPPADALDKPIFAALRPLPSLLINVGATLILASLLLAAGLAAVPPKTSAASTAPAVVTQQVVKDSPSPPKAPLAVSTDANKDESFGERWINKLSIEPGAILLWGTSSLVLGLVLAELLLLGWWRTLMLCLARLVKGVLGKLPLYGRWADAFLQAQESKFHGEYRSKRSLSIPEAVTIKTAPPDSLRAHAEEWLKTIKFQQSYTSGWSGSLKLPVGFEGGINSAVTLAQNQLSLPEIVHFLARFLEEVSRKYQVIIGIDEMDKLASDKLAQRFLNDIKSIFGLEHCFYLISVSENAMSNFERRGLPFRDVFDSSFDDFVYVDHLNFQSAQELLEQRIVGRPIPFFAMSYCMSGGLARDLIRNFRRILELHEQAPAENSLSSICARMVISDLQAKVRAAVTSAKKIALEPQVTHVLEQLHILEYTESDDALIGKGGGLLTLASMWQKADTKTDNANSNEGQRRAAKLEKLIDLLEELATYLYFAVTLRQFFNDSLPESKLTQPAAIGYLDTLAKARQLLGVSPDTTRIQLLIFRHNNGLAHLPEALKLGEPPPANGQ